MKDTRQRLLESACKVFAENGFHDANVADICERADANIASINYYFGGKQKLYEETLLYAAELAERKHPLMPDESEAATAEDRLAWFIRSQFIRGQGKGLASCFDRIVVHEITNPSPSHEMVFGKIMRPRREYLFELVRELLPREATEGHVRVCVHNVVGLFAFSHFLRLHGKRPPRRRKLPPPPPPEVMAHHATVFALGGIEAIARLQTIEHPPFRHEEDAKREKR